MKLHIESEQPKQCHETMLRAQERSQVRNVQRDGYTVSYEQLTWDNSIEGEEDES
ncbi:coil containing protein [Vibrio phage 1.172.O._10N.261.52.F5]|nr:coil containing protein [Vibrio phage 1.116.O._10N.222.52.C10]AUR92443.1 coil containing protein [Vibrio phage 1.172.O._10N.261.52.F5]